MTRSDKAQFSTKFGEVNVQLNFPPGSENKNDESFLYLNIRQAGGAYAYSALSRDDTAILRDHLTALLGETEAPESKAVISDEAVSAMKELAYQMSVFYTDDLTEALNKFTKMD